MQVLYIWLDLAEYYFQMSFHSASTAKKLEMEKKKHVKIKDGKNHICGKINLFYLPSQIFIFITIASLRTDFLSEIGSGEMLSTFCPKRNFPAVLERVETVRVLWSAWMRTNREGWSRASSLDVFNIITEDIFFIKIPNKDGHLTLLGS